MTALGVRGRVWNSVIDFDKINAEMTENSGVF
jgi:hypothetical protein